MSDGAISQDEIDALLSGVAIDGLNSSGHVGNGPNYHIDIDTLQKMADDLKPQLEEKINSFTGASFKVDNPIVELSDRDKVLAKLPEVVIAVSADYTDGIKGNHLYLLSSDFAIKLFSLVQNEEVTDVDDMVLSVVSEIIATHISAQILTIEQSGKLKGLAYGTPAAANESKAMVMFPQGDFTFTSYPLTLDGSAYTLWECIGGDASEKISNALGEKNVTEDPLSGLNVAPDMSAMNSNNMTQIGNNMNQMGGMQNSMAGMSQMSGMQNPMGAMNPMGGMQNPMAGMNQIGAMNPMGGMNQFSAMNQMGMGQMTGMNMGMNVPNVHQLQFPNLQNSINSSEQGNIGLIMDVLMEMTVELGRTKKSIKDILGMGEGTIIELDKLAGEPVDILVNHKPIAKGEVVVIDENFGVRVTEILSPMERVSDIN